MQYHFDLPSSVQNRSRVDGPLHVVGDVEIDLAVAVVVEEGGARREPGVPDAGSRRDVLERPVAGVPVQPVRAEVREVEVHEPVVVVVGRGDAEPVGSRRQPGAARDVGERAVAVVAVHGRHGGPRRWLPRPGRRVHEDDVEPAVVVEIDEGTPGPEGLGKVLLAERAAHVAKREARGAGDVGEGDRGVPGLRLPRDRAHRHQQEQCEK